jgi:hypothetical protein
MNLTPKLHYQANKPFANAHRDLVVSTQFREALHAALINHVLSLPTTNEPAAAAACYHQIVGARDFITQLLNVAEQPKTPPTTPPANLDHKIR